MSPKPAPPVRNHASDPKPPKKKQDDLPGDGLLLPNQEQLASWSASTLVHMVLILALALMVFTPSSKETPQELVLADQDPTDTPLSDEPPLKLNPDFKLEPFKPEPAPPVLIEAEAATANSLEKIAIVAAHAQVSPDAAMDFLENSANMTSLITEDNLASQLADRADRRRTALRRGTVSAECESALMLALDWLARHQNSDGSWSFVHTPGNRCSGFANPGDKQTRMGATGLALLTFLGAGYTHKEHKYQDVVGRGMKYVVGHMTVEKSKQKRWPSKTDHRPKATGRLFERNGASHEHMYAHGIATCALAEAYGMTQDPKLKAPAQLAINYIVQAQDPKGGGWMYTPRAGGDTSVVGWQIMALKSAVSAYLHVPGHVKPLTNKWLDSVQSDLPPGGYAVGSRYGYRRPGDRHGKSGACTAIGLLCRNYLGTRKSDAGLEQGVKWIGSRGPTSDDMYFNYYASMVMFQNSSVNREPWKNWKRQMSEQLVASQVKAGRDRGSWHFAGNHGSAGGRLYNTALAGMTLEVPYRYLPIYQLEVVERDDFPLE